MSFGVEDDGTPRAALDIAGQGVRAFNHRSGTRFHRSRDGWAYVPDVYRCLGDLTYLVGMLPQVCDHMAQAMAAAVAAGEAGADPGSQYEGDPAAAVTQARSYLGDAVASARNLYAAFEAAQRAISRIHYSGPALDGEDD